MLVPLLPGVVATLSCLALLLGVVVLDVRQQILIQHERVWLKQSLNLQEDLEAISVAVRDAETGQRGYLLTGRAPYLAPHDEAAARLPFLQATLRRLVADDPIGDGLAKRLDVLIGAKMAELADTIRLRDAAGEDAARAIVLSDAGQRLMVQIVATLDGMRMHADRVLAARRRSVDDRIDAGKRLSFVSLALGVVLLVFAARLFARFVRGLRESETMFRMIWEHAGDLIARVNSDGRLMYVSPSAERVLGYKAGELNGCSVLPLVHPEDRPQVAAMIEALLAGKVEHHAMSARYRRPDGTERWIETDRQVMRDPVTGRADGYVAISRDVTEQIEIRDALRRQAHDLEASNAELERTTQSLAGARDEADRASWAKTKFLASMSHELRTPLNAILGYAQLLGLEGQFDAVQSGRLEAMRAAGQHLLDLINQVLDFAEIEAARVDLRRAAVDPREEAERCVSVIRGIAEAKGLGVAIEIGAGVPARILCDRTRVRQVLLNLLGNAVKFTERGSIALSLGVEADGMLRFTVADTGPGVPAAAAPLLFQDFRRFCSGAVDPGGAGLGLAISARLAGLMGGAVGHADRPGGGSLFWLDLAVVVPTEVQEAGEGVASAGARSLRVLVVDDAPMNRDVATSFLRGAGHVATTAESGEEAVDAARRASFDVILMDVRMPGIGGLEAARRIRRLPEGHGGPRIVALTAQVFAEQVEACRKAGMDSHLGKPFSREALLQALLDEGGARAMPAEGHVEPSDPAGEPLALLGDVLPPGVIAEYLRGLIGQGEFLATALGGGTVGAADLAAAAHTLSGTAGMFGFLHLTGAARRFERSAMEAAPLREGAVWELQEAIAGALPEMRRLVGQFASAAEAVAA